MRTARVLGLLALIAPLFGPAVAGGQVAPPPGVWVVTTDPHHASCLPQALPTAELAIRVQGKVGTVIVRPGTRRCEQVADRLLAYGIDEVVIDGVRHALLDLRAHCVSPRDERVRWALSLAEFQRAEEQLWDRLQAGLDADAAGSLDVKIARDLAARCRTMAAEILAPPDLDTSAISTYRRLRFTHGAWTGTLDDLRREKCPQLAAAAERTRRRASVYVRLAPARQDLFASSVEGWYLPGASAPTLDISVLAPARVWFRVDDLTLEDLVDHRCPFDAPAVTRYTRYAFAGDRVVDRRVTIRCAPFSPAALR